MFLILDTMSLRGVLVSHSFGFCVNKSKVQFNSLCHVASLKLKFLQRFQNSTATKALHQNTLLEEPAGTGDTELAVPPINNKGQTFI